MPGTLENQALLSLTSMKFDSDTDLAWLAGFIDGEGCIRIGRDQRPGRTIQYYMLVDVTQKDPSVLLALKDVWGGSVSISHLETGGVSRWYVKAQKAANLLQSVLPYLVVKKEQAEVALDFQSRRLKTSVGPKRIDRTQDDADYWVLRDLKKAR